LEEPCHKKLSKGEELNELCQNLNGSNVKDILITYFIF